MKNENNLVDKTKNIENKRSLMILDEAHNIENKLMKLYDIMCRLTIIVLTILLFSLLVSLDYVAIAQAKISVIFIVYFWKLAIKLIIAGWKRAKIK